MFTKFRISFFLLKFCALFCWKYKAELDPGDFLVSNFFSCLFYQVKQEAIIDNNKDYSHSKRFSALFFFCYLCYVTNYLNAQRILFLKNENSENKVLFFLLDELGFAYNATKIPNKRQVLSILLKYNTMSTKLSTISPLIINNVYHKISLLFSKLYVFYF